MGGLALAEAFWCRMCAGLREDGSEIADNDPFWTELHDAALAAKADPLIWIAQSKFYGDIGREERFATTFSQWLRTIWQRGSRAAIAQYLG